MEELVKYMRAMLMLQLQTAREAAKTQDAPFKPELLLADAGFSHRDIALILTKSPVAVAKAVSRGRAGLRKDSGDDRFGGREEEINE